MEPKKILVCWNECIDKEEDILKIKLHELLSYKDEKFFFNFAYSYEQFDNELKNIAKIHSLIVLCELTWSPEARPTDFKGIELVQQQIRVKYNQRPPINLPVLFLSFENRKEIIRQDSTKLIINALGLGHHFMQLPVANSSEVQKFWEMRCLTVLEMKFIIYLCSYNKQVAIIRHDITNETDLNRIKQRLRLIIDKTNSNEFIDKLESIELNDIDGAKIYLTAFCEKLEKALNPKYMNI